MPASIFQIEDGRVALALVDSGDDPDDMAPNGHDLTNLVLATDYPGATGWSCQVTSGILTASANTNDVTVPATFCQASQVVPQPGTTSYALDLEWLQDVDVSTGLNKFLFLNDTEEAYFFLGLNAEDPPKAIGKVRLIAGSFGGPARENLTATVSLPCSVKPNIEFGDATTSTIVTTVFTPDLEQTSVEQQSAAPTSKSSKAKAEPEPVPA